MFLRNEPKLFERQILCITLIHRTLHRLQTVFAIGFVLENEPNLGGLEGGRLENEPKLTMTPRQDSASVAALWLDGKRLRQLAFWGEGVYSATGRMK